jgi:GTP cyclohydrolase I
LSQRSAHAPQGAEPPALHVEAEHLCMSVRGVQARGCRTVTSALHGLVRDDPRSRGEFFALAGMRA